MLQNYHINLVKRKKEKKSIYELVFFAVWCNVKMVINAFFLHIFICKIKRLTTTKYKTPLLTRRPHCQQRFGNTFLQKEKSSPVILDLYDLQTWLLCWKTLSKCWHSHTWGLFCTMNVQIVCISEEIYHSAFRQIITVNKFESATANASKLL